MAVSLSMKMANGEPFFKVENGVSQPSAKWTELHIQIINASPDLAAKYEASAAANTPYIISRNNGIYFDSSPEKKGIYVSQDYFRVGTPEETFANSLYIAIKGGHETQHGADSRNTSIGLPKVEDYKTPGDFSIARGIIEGRAVAFEALADAQLQGGKFVVNGRSLTVDSLSYSVGGDVSPLGLDFLLAEIYSNSSLTAAQKFEKAALEARDGYLEKIPSTTEGGISYFEQNMRAFAQAWTGFDPKTISNVKQDDNGYWAVTASTETGSVTRNYDPRTVVGAGALWPRPNSEVTTSNLDGGATLISSINYDSKKEVVQLFDADNNLIRRTEIVPVGTGGRISTISTYLPGTSQPDQVTVQQVDANDVVVTAPLVNGTEVNAVSLSTITTAPAPSRTPTPDGTSLGPSATNNNLVSSGSYTVGIARNFWNVNTATGNQAVIGYAITDGLRPGNSNFGLNIDASSGLGLPIARTGAIGNTDPVAGPIDYGLFGSSLNNASGFNFNLVPADPLVLDLNGDGVKLSDYGTSPVLFDADNDGGSLEQTGWVSAQDGIVVHDLDGDGKINNIRETLSEYYNGVAGSNGVAGTRPYANGFAALKSLDSNADNQFTVKDAAWNNLRVWVDANHDGKTDAGELKTFANLGITAINLAAVAQSGEVRDGNEVLARGTFMQNGVSREAIAANFLANPAGSTVTQSSSGVTVVTENVVGGAGATIAYVSKNTNAAINETLNAASLQVRNLTGGAGGDVLTGDASNNWLAGGTGADTLLGGAGDDVLLFDAADKRVDGGDGFDIAQAVGAQGVSLNLSQSNIEMAVGGIGNDVFVGGGRSTVVVRGGAGDDVIIGGAANDVLSGEDGDDTLDGGAGNDLIRGHRGHDRLLGGAGDDVVDGGLDDDDLSGGAGNDVLIGGRGDDNLKGGDGIDVAQYAGSYADYRITKLDSANGSTRYRVVDTRTGQDGADTLTGIEKLSFADVSRVDLTIGSPLPVKDVLTVNSTGQALSRAAAHLLSKDQLLLNDRDWDSDIGQLKITEVLDAKGGTVALTASGDVLFTPDARYTGVMGFKYKVKDAEGHFTEVSNSATGQTEPMKAAVYLQTGDLPSDPLAAEQWYLSDVNVMPVWQDYTGKGIRIGQFEPGGAFSTDPEVFDYRHPDLQPNADRVWLNTLDANGRNDAPQTFSSHATMVAGVMAAARNGEGGIGVAYDATLAGHYIQGEGLEVGRLNQEITDALAKFKDFDVVNNSWGPSKSFGLDVVPEGSLEQGILDAVAHGRDGLGTAIVMAGGNDRATGANTNYNALTANRAVIVAGSINAPGDLGTLQLGSKPFSNPGASILVSAPGSNIDSTSRELIADNGSTFGGDYGTSQGTSFAAPIVSGVIALMLEANPALGYRDIQAILAMTATKVSDPNGTDWVTNGAKTWNGGGMHASHDYGFGKVDARAAVRLAETWTEQNTYANQFATTVASGILKAAIPDGSGMLTRTLSVGSGLEVESAQVTLELEHQRWGDLIIKLISPGGTESILVNRPDKAPGSAASDLGNASSGPLSFSFNTTHVLGEQSTGSWTLQVIDAVTGNVGTLNNWTLDLYGKKVDTNDLYVYTNEYAGNAGFARNALTDGNGGRDTINASAVTGDSTINLINGSASKIAGTALSIGGDIEIAFGGDGNDTLTGNGLSNVLLGGRGADVISGGDGNDTLDGSKGNDVLTGGAGSDLFVIGKDAGAQDAIVDFAIGDGPSAPETIALVGFGNLNFATLVRTQVGADVQLELGDGQSVLVRNRQANQLGVAQFQFFASQAALQAWQQAGQGSAAGADSDTVLQGTAGDDLLIGGGGNDTLSGNAGNDRLLGGAGLDILDGGAGDDVLVLDGDQGRISFSTGLAGTGVRTGGAGADRFLVAPDGGGSPSMGFYSNDIGTSNLISDFELAVDKIDLSQFAWIKDFSQLKINKALNINGKFITRILAQAEGQSTVSVGLSAIDPTVLTAAHFVFAGSADAVPLPVSKASSSTVAGAAPLAIASPLAAGPTQPLPIVGTGANDVLTGDAGANTINGLAGADSMTGRTGDDIYIVDNIGDKASELPGGGYDTVQSGVSYQLSDDVEVLVLTGTGNLDATGNGQRNRLVGNAGDNRLDGGAEADDMVGGAGNDVYVVDNQLDTVSEDFDAGVDAILSSVSWTLGKNLENLGLIGTRDVNGTGNELANALSGNAGDNILDGAQGADSMVGGAGNDTYYVDNVGDTVVEALNAGVDTVYTSINAVLGSDVENAVLLGTATSATGNALDNALIGNALANVLVGGLGNDHLSGYAGDDSLDGGSGDDCLSGGEGNDTLRGGGGIDTVVFRGALEDYVFMTSPSGVQYVSDTVAGRDGIDLLNGLVKEDRIEKLVFEKSPGRIYSVDEIKFYSSLEYIASFADLRDAFGTDADAGWQHFVKHGAAEGRRPTSNAATDIASLGSAQDRTVVDQDNSQSWSRVDMHFDSQGREDWRNTFNDDGTRDWLDTDQTNERGDRSIAIRLDAKDREDWRNVIYDNGTRDWQDTDQANERGDRSITLRFDAKDREDWRNVINDDGTRDWLDADQANERSDRSIAIRFDAKDREDWRNVINDDGTRDWLDTDQTNERGDRSIAIRFDAKDREDWRNVIYDNGTRDWQDTDQANERGDRSITLRFDAKDREDWRNVINDDGTRDWLDTDQANERSDRSIAIRFDAKDREDWRNVINDDGTRVLTGSAAMNTLKGYAGSDTLDGKEGDDLLSGGAGNDTYVMGRGYGVDRVDEDDATTGNADVAVFDASVDQLWFRQIENDLEVSLIGTGDKLVVNDWYLGSQHHVEQFKSISGKTLMDSQVQNLVQAMASFAPPAAGQTALPANYQASLMPIIAANWH